MVSPNSASPKIRLGSPLRLAVAVGLLMLLVELALLALGVESVVLHVLVAAVLAAVCVAAAVHWGLAVPMRRQVRAMRDAAAAEQTESQLIERALADSEQRFREIFEHAGGALMLADAETGEIIECNRQAEQMLAMSRERIIGMPHWELSPAEEREQWRAVFERDVESGGRSHGEAVLISANGERIPVYVHSHVFELGTRRVILGLFVDVTERKRAEEELEIFKRFSEASAQGFAIGTLDGHVTYANPALLRHLRETKPEEVIGKTMFDYSPPEAAERLREEIMPAVFEQGRWVGEVRVRTRDGDIIPMIATLFTIPDDRGRPHMLAAVLTDISERKEAEAQLSRYADELQNALEAAEAASRAKSEFLANMSHEVRTPLNGVLGMAELLADTTLNSEQYEYVSMICSSAESLLSLVNDVLDFSKIEAGKLKLEEAPFSVRDVVETVANSFALRAHGKDLDLICHVPLAVPDAVLGDAVRLRQVLVNLVDNAVKFTEEGEVLVRVEPVEEREDTVTLGFVVRDTGVGIPAEKQHAVFENFAQADGSTTRKYGGTGLGLAISRQLAMIMGGRLELSSTRGRGSTFRFVAVFKRASDQQAFALEPPAELQGVRTLVVEHNVTNLGFLTELLTAWGLQVEGAGSADTALRRLREAEAEGAGYRLVLLDDMMPDVGAIELAEQVREVSGQEAPSVILLGSPVVCHRSDRYQRYGIQQCLSKPVRQSALLAALTAELGEQGGAGQDEDGSSSTTLAQLVTQLGGIVVLLAEDNKVNQRLVTRILTRENCTVDVAGDGREAVSLYEQNPERYDLILMDVQMPGMDGFAAAGRIRDTEQATERHVPIVAMTAYTMPGDREQCIEAGMDGYLGKPTRRRALLRVINRFLSEQPAQPEARPLPPTPFSHEEPTPVDLDEAMAHVDGDVGLLLEIYNIFVTQDAPKRLAELRRAVQAEDAESLRRAAHSLRGSLASLGARRAAQMLRELQEKAEQADAQDLEAVIDQLQSELETVERFFEQQGWEAPPGSQ